MGRYSLVAPASFSLKEILKHKEPKRTSVLGACLVVVVFVLTGRVSCTV